MIHHVLKSQVIAWQQITIYINKTWQNNPQLQSPVMRMRRIQL